MVYRQAVVHKTVFRKLPFGAAFVFSSDDTATPMIKDSRDTYRDGGGMSVTVSDLSSSVLIRPNLGQGTETDTPSSGGGDVQDMQVEWTPTNVKLSEYTGPLVLYGADSGITVLTSSIAVIRLAGIDIEDQASLTSISLTSLTSIQNGTLNIKNLPSLTSFSAPLLASVLKADVEFVDVGLVSLSLPSLVTIFDLAHASSSGLDLECPSLTTVSFPSYVPFNGAYVYTASPLNAASVNHILARHVANAAYVSGDINMADGGEAAPTGQGIADKATLIGRGVTVTTN